MCAVAQRSSEYQGSSELPRIPIPRTRVNKSLLACLLALPGCVRAQPQRDVCGLHSLPYHPHQVFAQGVQVCFVAQLSREGLQGLSSIVLPAVEAPVYEGLDATPQGGEQRGNDQGGDDDS